MHLETILDRIDKSRALSLVLKGYIIGVSAGFVLAQILVAAGAK